MTRKARARQYHEDIAQRLRQVGAGWAAVGFGGLPDPLGLL